MDEEKKKPTAIYGESQPMELYGELGRRFEELFGPNRESGAQRELRHRREEGAVMALFAGPVTEVDAHVLHDHWHRLGFKSQEAATEAATRLMRKGAIEYDYRRRTLKILPP